jgi:hypothetical protein
VKKTVFILLILASIASFSQFKITGYLNAEIDLNYELTDNFQMEVRVHDNLGIEFNTELSLLNKFISKDDYNVNFGMGISTFPFHSKNIKFLESLYLPLHVEITPFKEVKKNGLVHESTFHFNEVTDASGTRNSIGIPYIFS